MNPNTLYSRRDLTKLGLGAGLGWLSGLGGGNSALADSSTDYKALVCIFLFGGNDGHNTVIPLSGANATNYKSIRGPLALPTLNAPSTNAIHAPSDGADYGLHFSLKKMQKLYNDGNAAIIANMGLIDQPMTVADVKSNSNTLANYKFSHFDMTNQMQAGTALGMNGSGWGGRLVDAVQPNGAPPPLSSVSLDNNCFFGSTSTNSATRMQPGMTFNQSALFNLGATDPRVVAQQALLGNAQDIIQGSDVPMVDQANSVLQNVLKYNGIMKAAAAPAWTTPFPTSSIGQQLSEVATIINMRASLGVRRQVFYCMQSGYDTHGGQDWGHMVILGELDAAINAFYSATVDMSLQQQVTTFTSAEFGRTLQPSGSGSDHGWGSHHFVIGGAVKGGDIYGRFPTLALAGPDDIGTRGVMLPTTGIAQVGATLATWFGAPQSAMPTLFPNLVNFPTQNLGFMA